MEAHASLYACVRVTARERSHLAMGTLPYGVLTFGMNEFFSVNLLQFS